MTPPNEPHTLCADLHVHSFHSGYTGHLLFFRCRDCYSDPEEIYRLAKKRGMDLVTITDHDSIDGCLEFLDRHPDAPDFIVGEEIEADYPDRGLKVHIGALGLNERNHREIQTLRGNVFDVIGYLRSEKVAFTLNHLFHFYTEQVELELYVESLLTLFSAVEVRNGTMVRGHNELNEELVRRRSRATSERIARVGGSDAHILRRVATSYTRVPATNRDEFLENLRLGHGVAVGRHGSVMTLATEIYGVIFNFWGSLVGLRRGNLSGGERGASLAFSVLSLPFQFTPMAIAVANKLYESHRVGKYRRWLSFAEEGLEPSTLLVEGEEG